MSSKWSIPALMAARVQPFDPDAQAFITATGITDLTIKNAINTLVVSAKSNGWWEKCVAIYPLVGGSATTCKYNLKDARDLDAAYRLNFSGTPTFASTGVTFANADTAGDTFIYPDDLPSGSVHMSFYSRTNNGFETAIEMGSGNVGEAFTILKILDQSASSGYMSQGKGIVSDFSNLPSNRSGLFMTSLVSGTVNFYRNGTSFASSSAGTLATQTSPLTILLGAFHSNLSGNFIYSPTTRECAFSTIGEEIDSTLAATVYTDVQAFQTALGRNV